MSMAKLTIHFEDLRALKIVSDKLAETAGVTVSHYQPTPVPAPDETAIMGTMPPTEAWRVDDNRGSFTAWLDTEGRLQWVEVGTYPQPSWRQVFVERRAES